MGENKEGENWQANPSLSGIDPDKMRFLTQMMGEVGGKDPAAALPFLSALSGSETGQKMNFSDNETDLILQVLMQRMSAEERSKIDMVRMLSRMIGQKK